jgi:hypothetical protein
VLATSVLQPASVPSSFAPVSVIDILAIAAGDYYLTLVVTGLTAGPAFEWGGTNANDFGSIGAVRRTATGPNPFEPLINAYSEFVGFPTLSMKVKLVGDVGDGVTPPGIPGGNRTFFDFNPPAIDGVGVTVADLGASHGMDSQSIGGSSDSVTSTLTRSFGFNTADTEAETVEVFIHAILEGRLIADNFSRASVESVLELRDAHGHLLASDRTAIAIQALGGQLVEALVFDVLTLQAILTPGEQYTLFSSLTLETEAGLMGAARAFFADTFAWEISGSNENPYGEVGSQTQILTRAFGVVPEPAGLGALALLAIGLFATPRRHPRAAP